MNLSLLKSEYDKLKLQDSNKFLLLYSIFEEQMVFLSKICKESEGQTLITCSSITKVNQIYKILLKYIKKEEIEIINKNYFKKDLLNKNKNINSNKIKVVLSTKTGLFSSFYNLKNIVVIDEEDKDHKQYDLNPRYNIKDIAFYLNKKNNIKLILTSQSPSIETYNKNLTLLDIREKNTFTTISLVDQKIERKSNNKLYISLKLQEKIEESINNNKTTVIINNDLKSEFKSNQKIKEELIDFCKSINIETSIITIDSKSEINKKELEKTQIIIGTEFLVKNYLNYIKNIETLAIFSIDNFIEIPNFKSNEKLFTYTTKFINLANEKQIKNIVIQTKYTNNEIFNLAIDQKYQEFYNKEISIRESLDYPPFFTIVKIIIKKKENKDKILEILNNNKIEILGENKIEKELKTKTKSEDNILIKINTEKEENKLILKQISEYCLLDINPDF